jgi:hypothetical protein
MRSHLLPNPAQASANVRPQPIRYLEGAVLAWNQRQVQKLSPAEIWLFIIGRGLVALGVGIVAAWYVPDLSRAAALPLIIMGLVCLVFAGRGFFRRQQG